MARISLLTTPWRLPLYLCSHGKLLGGKSSLAVKGIYSRLSKQVGDRGSISLAINSIVATVKNIGLTPQIIVQTIKNMLSIVRSILSTHASIASSVNVNNEKPCVGHQAIKNMFSTIDNMLSTDRKTSLVNKPFCRSLKSICRPLEYVYWTLNVYCVDRRKLVQTRCENIWLHHSKYIQNCMLTSAKQNCLPPTVLCH